MLDHVKSWSGRIARDKAGAISLIFGLVMIVMFGIAGLGVDSLRAQRAANRVAGALDAASLAAARAMNENDSMTDTDLIAYAQQVFAANAAPLLGEGITTTTPVVSLDRTNFEVEIRTTATVPTTISRAVGQNAFSVNKTSKVVFAPRRIELAMVLDVTGSMGTGGKLTSMKNAAKEVVDVLFDPNKPSQSRISIVPYSAAVNVGSYATAASGGDSLDGCVMERLFPENRDNDTVSGAPNNYAVMGQLNSGTSGRYVCPSATIMPLTNDSAGLKSHIETFSAGGWTAGHIGLAWGWNTISPKWSSVFSGSKAPGGYSDTRYVKAILLMTDGLFNTAYTAGTSDTEQTAESHARTVALCDAIKAEGVTIYSVAYDMDPTAESLLQSCASSLAHFYAAGNESELRASFKKIAGDLQQIRLSK